MKIVMILENKRNPYLLLNMNLLKIESHENVDKMYYRFNHIIKDLKLLGKNTRQVNEIKKS